MQRNTYIGLGSNLGDRAGALARALDGIDAAGLFVQRVSSVYESEPIGPVRDQPAFLNVVAEVRSELAPRAQLAACLEIEGQLGRLREVDKGPRTIDLDLLLIGDRVASWPELSLPHPALTERAFVLAPLCELDPAAQDPRDGSHLAMHLQRIRRTQVLVCRGPLKGLLPPKKAAVPGPEVA